MQYTLRLLDFRIIEFLQLLHAMIGMIQGLNHLCKK